MRQPRPYYRAARDSWCVQIGKKQITLAKGRDREADAWRAYHRLMAAQGLAPPTADIIVALALDLFLDHAKRSVAPPTYEQYRIKLQDFTARFGRLPIATLRPKHVTAWIAGHTWSESTQRGAITAVKVALNWCAAEGHIPSNPLARVRRPRMGRRERTIDPEERATIRAAFGDCFGDVLDALTWTGTRPGEIARLEARHVDWDAAYAALPGKTTAATGDMIEFPLIPPMLALCRRLAEANPTGPLFRNRQGNPWTENAIRCRMRRLRQRTTGLDGVTAYTYRHSFITDALERGVPVTDVAALANHKDIRTTMNYNHLNQRRAHLHRQAVSAQGGADAATGAAAASDASAHKEAPGPSEPPSPAPGP